MQTLRERFRFFLEHSGYYTPPGRAACALSSARDEARGEELGLVFEWQDDELADTSWCERCQSEVVEAELAGEALACIDALEHVG